MDQKDFKKLLDEALKPVKDTQKEHTRLLGEHTDSLDALKSSVINIEAKISIYDDMYKANNDNAKKLEKRVETLEDKNGVRPPPELMLTGVQ